MCFLIYCVQILVSCPDQHVLKFSVAGAATWNGSRIGNSISVHFLPPGFISWDYLDYSCNITISHEKNNTTNIIKKKKDLFTWLGLVGL